MSIKVNNCEVRTITVSDGIGIRSLLNIDNITNSSLDLNFENPNANAVINNLSVINAPDANILTSNTGDVLLKGPTGVVTLKNNNGDDSGSATTVVAKNARTLTSRIGDVLLKGPTGVVTLKNSNGDDSGSATTVVAKNASTLTSRTGSVLLKGPTSLVTLKNSNGSDSGSATEVVAKNASTLTSRTGSVLLKGPTSLVTLKNSNGSDSGSATEVVAKNASTLTSKTGDVLLKGPTGIVTLKNSNGGDSDSATEVVAKNANTFETSETGSVSLTTGADANVTCNQADTVVATNAKTLTSAAGTDTEPIDLSGAQYINARHTICANMGWGDANEDEHTKIVLNSSNIEIHHKVGGNDQDVIRFPKSSTLTDGSISIGNVKIDDISTFGTAGTLTLQEHDANINSLDIQPASGVILAGISSITGTSSDLSVDASGTVTCASAAAVVASSAKTLTSAAGASDDRVTLNTAQHVTAPNAVNVDAGSASTFSTTQTGAVALTTGNNATVTCNQADTVVANNADTLTSAVGTSDYRVTLNRAEYVTAPNAVNVDAGSASTFSTTQTGAVALTTGNNATVTCNQADTVVANNADTLTSAVGTSDYRVTLNAAEYVTAPNAVDVNATNAGTFFTTQTDIDLTVASYSANVSIDSGEIVVTFGGNTVAFPTTGITLAGLKLDGTPVQD